MHPSAKTMFITGAGSGVGRGLALNFAARGLTVYASDVSEAGAAETVRAVVDAGGRAEAVVLDVTDAAACERAVAGLPDGRVDVLVNNAGLQHVAPLEAFPVEKWNLLIDVMLKGATWMTRATLPGMKARNYGRIVNIGSIHALVASPFKTAYTAAKHGLLGMSKVVALETADVDVTINTICPSYIRTPLVDRQITDQSKAHGIPEAQVIEQIMLKPMPKRAFISVEEVAGTVAFLSGAEARNITGQAIAMDGGWTAQ